MSGPATQVNAVNLIPIKKSVITSARKTSYVEAMNNRNKVPLYKGKHHTQLVDKMTRVNNDTIE